jgi:peptidoglycan hydrolase CwlO-like protein
MNAGTLLRLILAAGFLAVAATSWSQQDAEIVKLREEVESKRKELRDAEQRLAKAMKTTTVKEKEGELPGLPDQGTSPSERMKPPKLPTRSLPGSIPADPQVTRTASSQVQDLQNDRLSALEKKMDRMLELLDAMKREVGSVKTDVEGTNRDVRALKRDVESRRR